MSVGPWIGPWPSDSRYDPELLREGDARNVADAYRYWTMDAIRADLAARRDPNRQLHVAIENWQHDFNIGSIVRTANAFNAAGVHIIGRRHWNRRGAMVTDRYLDVYHHNGVGEFQAWLNRQPVFAPTDSRVVAPAGSRVVAPAGSRVVAPAGSRVVEPVETTRRESAYRLPIIGIDNLPGAIALETFTFPASCVLLFGAESTGLSTEMQAACDDIVQITQFGSTRSINAGAAAAIAMWAWRVHARSAAEGG